MPVQVCVSLPMAKPYAEEVTDTVVVPPVKEMPEMVESVPGVLYESG